MLPSNTEGVDHSEEDVEKGKGDHIAVAAIATEGQGSTKQDGRTRHATTRHETTRQDRARKGGAEREATGAKLRPAWQAIKKTLSMVEVIRPWNVAAMEGRKEGRTEGRKTKEVWTEGRTEGRTEGTKHIKEGRNEAF